MLDLQNIRAAYGFEIWIALIEEIRVMAVDPQFICAEHGLEVWRAIWVNSRMKLNMKRNCVDKWL
jgi:hypothetical protein